MTDRREDTTRGPAPESAMGGAGDSGAGGGHPASRAAVDREHASPDRAAGDVPIERRRGIDSEYRGPERRVARQNA